MVPPHPIPNWVVKRTYADGTYTAGCWESRETRGVFYIPKFEIHRLNSRTGSRRYEVKENRLEKTRCDESSTISSKTDVRQSLKVVES